jgi:hypothetical protein
MNVSELASRMFYHAPAVGRGCNIGGFKYCAAAGGADFACQMLARFLIQVHDAYRRALAGEKLGGGPANAARPSGDQDRLAAKLPHRHPCPADCNK